MGYEQDMVAFKDYQQGWRERKLLPDNLVLLETKRWAKVVAKKFDCIDHVDDLEDEALISIGTESNYEGRCSLINYIMRVLVSKVRIVKEPLVHEPRKHKKEQEESKEEQEEPKEARGKQRYVGLDAQNSNDDENSDKPGLDLPDKESLKPFEEVLLRMGSEKFMNELLTARPEVQRTIVEIVLSHEEYLGHKRLAEEATKKLKRKVTRHEVEVALTLLTAVINTSLWYI